MMRTLRRGEARTGTILALIGLVLVLAGIVAAGLGAFGAGSAAQPEPDAASLSDDELATLGSVVQKLMMEGRWEEAAGSLEAAVARRPDNAEIRERYAQTLMQLGRFAEARDQWQALIDLGEATAENEFLAGMCASSAGDRERAVEHFERALAAKPNDANYALNLGITQRNLGRLDQARASLVIAVTLDPSLAVGWGTLAQIALAKGEREIALEQVARARRLAPEQPAWVIVEADALLRSGPGPARDPEQALGLLAGLDDDWLLRRDALEIAKRALGMLRRPGEAGALYARAADLNPTDAALAAEAASLLAQGGQHERALEYARRAVRLGDEGSQPLLDRLVAQVETGG